MSVLAVLRLRATNINVIAVAIFRLSPKDYRWMYQCSECGLHFFEDEDSQIAKTGKCKKCQKET